MSYDNPISTKKVMAIIGGVVVVLVVVFVALIGIYTLTKSIGRSQDRADATNRVKISTIEIQNQTQRVLIAKQQAEIRLQDAIGVRGAQDEIAKTLTPLYVQYEMTQVLLKVAESGHNNSVVYLPSGANGIPLVSTLDPTKVGQGESAGK